MPPAPTRRTAIKNILAGTAAAGAAGTLSAFAPAENEMEMLELNNNINHSVCRWCYNDLTLDQLCAAPKAWASKALIWWDPTTGPR